MTNRQIADRLRLSRRTVDAHLYRVFPKLRVTARAGLRDALGRTSGSDASGAEPRGSVG
jgi:DNA-binding NarL/FixJ family response regulator